MTKSAIRASACGIAFLASRERETNRHPSPRTAIWILVLRPPRGNGQGTDLEPHLCAGGVLVGADDRGSTIRYSTSGWSDIAAKMRHQSPLWFQRLKRAIVADDVGPTSAPIGRREGSADPEFPWLLLPLLSGDGGVDSRCQFQGCAHACSGKRLR
ncbi:hypothetical protein MAXJ12_33594 [Mesorhizobium alhagi CCNWXJ12-2]|uniref:Uncharacterized protein n=1 Tax=Mesorhizobium alhagi CCNWXJ12-2 TaxID=1107882 RepID=H0I2L3_9HYPH|nr:hypothetical protein MAXJ12_33594 [Mesorhizobium alhagi CCNWXJ12-2]